MARSSAPRPPLWSLCQAYCVLPTRLAHIGARSSESNLLSRYFTRLLGASAAHNGRAHNGNDGVSDPVAGAHAVLHRPKRVGRLRPVGPLSRVRTARIVTARTRALGGEVGSFGGSNAQSRAVSRRLNSGRN